MPADRVDYHAALLRLYGFPQPKAGLRVLTLLRKEKSCYQKASANFIFLQLFFKCGVFPFFYLILAAQKGRSFPRFFRAFL
jgi:hypothetical protein